MTRKIYINNQLIEADLSINIEIPSEDVLLINGLLKVYNFDLLENIIYRFPISVPKARDAGILIETEIDDIKQIIFKGYITNLISGQKIANNIEEVDTVFEYRLAVNPKQIITDSKVRQLANDWEVIPNKQRATISLSDTSEAKQALANYGIVLKGDPDSISAQIYSGGLYNTVKDKMRWRDGYRGILEAYKSKGTRQIPYKHMFYKGYSVKLADYGVMYQLKTEPIGLVLTADIINAEIEPNRFVELYTTSVAMILSNYENSYYEIMGVQTGS